MESVAVIYNVGGEGVSYFRWLKFWALLGVCLVVVGWSGNHLLEV
jgi:hypothetical protein